MQLNPEISGPPFLIRLLTGHRSIAAVATAVVHVLAVMLLILIQEQPERAILEPRNLHDQPAYYVVENVIPPASRAREASPRNERNRTTRPAAREPEALGSAAGPTVLDLAPEKRPGPVDWENEAHVVAGDAVANIAGNEARKCLDVPEPGSWLPPCSQRAINMPESKGKERISFPIGFSYVGLNVRVGNLKPDGHLFDDMRNPDLDRSSVPDSSDVHQLSNAALRHQSVVFRTPMARPGAPR